MTGQSAGEPLGVTRRAGREQRLEPGGRDSGGQLALEARRIGQIFVDLHPGPVAFDAPDEPTADPAGARQRGLHRADRFAHRSRGCGAPVVHVEALAHVTA